MLSLNLVVDGIDCEIKYWCLRQSCLSWQALANFLEDIKIPKIFLKIWFSKSPRLWTTLIFNQSKCCPFSYETTFTEIHFFHIMLRSGTSFIDPSFWETIEYDESLPCTMTPLARQTRRGNKKSNSIWRGGGGNSSSQDERYLLGAFKSWASSIDYISPLVDTEQWQSQE